MTAWERILAKRRKGKRLAEIFRENGIVTDCQASHLDLLGLMQQQGWMRTGTDRALFQELEDALMDVWTGPYWTIQAGDAAYRAPTPARALQRLVLDLSVQHASALRRCIGIPCPYNGKLLFAESAASLAGPSEDLRIDADALPGDVFCHAEWVCRACGMHASVSFLQGKTAVPDLPTEFPEQLCMPGMESPAADPDGQTGAEVTVLSNAVQLGMPLFGAGEETASWIEVPIDARETEETDTVSAGELAGLFGESAEPLPEMNHAPVQGEQLSWLDQL